MEASLVLHSNEDRESGSGGKKSGKTKMTSIQTRRSLITSRTDVGDWCSRSSSNMDHMMLNPSDLYPYPISSSSSLSRHDSYPYPLHQLQLQPQFQQPPLLPLPVNSSSSSHESNTKLHNNDQRHTKQAHTRPQKHSSHKTKKNPNSKQGLGAVGSTKKWGPESESERLSTKQMNFYESLIFAMSPPPSSLPMPKFSILKTKLSKVVR